ncbi:ATP-binding cassette domain-containing protein [Spiroplasma floricola]|uniref:ATP-binding cassette domain-containing protein n=1 Tax=Spiroplasma floricola TaxID=216937 RepID=UPI0012FE4613|nr:ATP-binding cassette domain-containing protein [Spiroplasma floricola]
MNYKFLKQKGENDCGIAISSMLINYYHNKDFGIEEIKFENSLNDEMLSLYDIENLLTKYKIEFVSYTCNFNELLEIDITNPIVLNVLNDNDLDHFIIVYKKRKNEFLIADPNLNDLKWVSCDEIKKIYQGYLSTTKVFDKVNFKNKSLLNWFTFLKKFKLEISLLFIVSILLNVLILISNNFIKIYMDNINLKNNKTMQLIFLTFALIFVVQTITSYFINKIIFTIKNKVTKDIFCFYKTKLVDLNIEKFNSFSKEEWIKKLSYINSMSDFISQCTISLPLGLTLFLMSSLFLLLISPFILTLVLVQNLISVCLSIVCFYFMKELKLRKERKIIEFFLGYRQLLDGFEEIKYKNIELEIKTENYKNYLSTIKETKNIFNLDSKTQVLFSLTNKLFFYLIFYISIIYINQEKYSLPDLLFYTAVSSYINIFFSNIESFILNIQETLIADKSLNFIFNSKDNNIEYKKINKIENITAKNLYKYKSDSCLLKDFNFEFDKNTFIHGKSGSGKTTLLKLLSGHYEKYEGELIVNHNINFNNLDKNSFLSKTIYLGQYDYLFNGTVWQNIQQFKNKVDFQILQDFHLIEILERNNIDLTKRIYDNGYNLSKGQRQIINFIALFFTNKDLYLIDEPLSNVDKHTAYFLFKTFMEYKKSSLIIMCDHDLAYSNFFEKRVEVI